MAKKNKRVRVFDINWDLWNEDEGRNDSLVDAGVPIEFTIEVRESDETKIGTELDLYFESFFDYSNKGYNWEIVDG